MNAVITQEALRLRLSSICYGAYQNIWDDFDFDIIASSEEDLKRNLVQQIGYQVSGGNRLSLVCIDLDKITVVFGIEGTRAILESIALDPKDIKQFIIETFDEAIKKHDEIRKKQVEEKERARKFEDYQRLKKEFEPEVK